MKLYHGTSERVARLALQNGLVPRSESGVSSLWEDHPSSPNHIYLTTAYAGYFAMNATTEGERWAIIEIDTDLLPDLDALVPDEDFLEQATRQQKLPQGLALVGVTSMKDRTEWFRENLGDFAHLWEDSISALGNCAHEGVIPPEAITRVSFVDPEGNPSMALMASDPEISLMNYRFCADKYRALINWFMGDEVDASAFSFGKYPVIPEGTVLALPPELQRQIRHQQGANSRVQAALADRTGVEVLKNEGINRVQK